MLLLAHTGITLGAATVLAGAAEKRALPPWRPNAWLRALGGYLDIRVLLVGSMLPDIIDKPVGQFFFPETFGNGRIFSHSLLFLVVIAAAGCYLYRRYRQVWLLTLAGGTLVHLVLDGIWGAPRTLFWPLLGFAFDRIELAQWVPNIFKALFSNPSVYVPELAGLAVLLWFGVVLMRRRKFGAFLRRGEIG